MIVDLVAGKIYVDIKKGVGSTFTFELLFKVLNEEEIEKFIKEKKEKEELEIGTKLIGKKILLVEDNMLNREIACQLLSDVGLIIDTAED